MTTIKRYTNSALDAIYNRTAGRMIAQITAISRGRTSRMQDRLKKLDEEAQRLKELEKRMEPDNAVLEQTLNEYRNVMNTSASLIQANDNEIQNAGMTIATIAVTAKVFLSLSGTIMQNGGNPITPQAMKYYQEQADKSGIKWNTLTALDVVTSYVDSPAWRNRMEKWGDGYADLARDILLQDIQNGAGPIASARHLRQIAENMPVHASETLTRTLQLTSFREASLAMELSNSDYIEGKIRIAELDDLTCLSCIALHGTPLAVGERVDDHYNGRCSEFYQVPGGNKYPSMMQADSKPGERNFVPFQTGTDWFNSLSRERQEIQRSFQQSPAKFRAFESGVDLREFVGDHNDDVFGHQFIERSLLDILGKEADKYYERNQE